MSHSDKKGSTGKRSWGRGQQDANAAPRREAYAGNHNPRQGGGAQHRNQSPSGLFFSAPGCGSQHPRVPWAALASCWPLPQQLLSVSATGRGRRCCRSQRLGMSTVVAAAAFARGVFNLTRTGIAAELTAASGGNSTAVRLHLEYHMPFYG